MLCDHLEGWGDWGWEGGSSGRGHHVYRRRLIPTDGERKLTRHCRAIILQLKINKLIQICF